jgi:hypothetical protein
MKRLIIADLTLMSESPKVLETSEQIVRDNRNLLLLVRRELSLFGGVRATIVTDPKGCARQQSR